MDPQPLSESEGARIAFGVIAGFGVVASAIAWAWYGLAQEEAQNEQGKAVAAGTSMAGFAEVVGGLPLVLGIAVSLD
ncbi:hypothetical protein GCM10023065_21660 [Microbacterium laevaniformans]|uniref:hypothetical protein n=1 Tax=Microbacterium laevaniformans TaxID=36807 RepID=UPI00039C495F|nr:hypothetical protein [Microbacterium laevaniformans]MBM7753123.1 hypothetical protein [Microbacterium laevaniformans]GLJ64422.1 hypothetical protein GCM10017578_13100 [Microbacterium laevaniformans]